MNTGVLLGVGLGGIAAATITYLVVRKDQDQAQGSADTNPNTTPSPGTPPIIAPNAGPQPGAPPRVSAFGRQPLTMAVWNPQSLSDIDALLATACRCVRSAPGLTDIDLARCIWRAHWPSVLYPESSHPDDHVTVSNALAMVGVAVTAARTQVCMELLRGDDESPEPAPEPAPSPEPGAPEPPAPLYLRPPEVKPAAHGGRLRP